MHLAELRLSSTLHGWDPLRIVAQCTVAQAVHYILLAAFVPPLLSIFTQVAALRFEGGPAQVGMILDWREVAGSPTWDWTRERGSRMRNTTVASNWTAGALWITPNTTDAFVLPPSNYTWTATELDVSPALGSTPASSGASLQELQLETWEWQHTHDARRGWAIAFAWLLTLPFDVAVLYYLVRKPTHVLDFVCTLHFVHFLVAWYVAGSVPLSMFWWLVMFVHASLSVLLAEKLAIGREMRTGFTEERLEANMDVIEMDH